eukprot:scaffold4409_cov369-Prasinococcus_capsulatus_cf.AAC.11
MPGASAPPFCIVARPVCFTVCSTHTRKNSSTMTLHASQALMRARLPASSSGPVAAGPEAGSAPSSSSPVVPAGTGSLCDGGRGVELAPARSMGGGATAGAWRCAAHPRSPTRRPP